MIVTFLFLTLLTFLTVVMAPFAYIASFLPVNLNEFISNAMGWWWSFVYVFWPLKPIAYSIAIYGGVKLLMLVGKVLLGSRMPDAS